MEIDGKIDFHGKPYFGPEWQAEVIYERLKKYVGKSFTLVVDVTESQKERRFFEGAMVPYFCTFYQGLDRKNSDDRSKMREILKQEFGGEIMPTLSGGVTKVCITSKGKVKEILRNAGDYLLQNGMAVPDPELYKKWRDVLLGEGNDYFDWLETNKLNVDGTPKELPGANPLAT